MTADAASLRPCPTCDGAVPADGKHRPFCSDRCRLVDLGRWFRGDYAVPAPLPPPGAAPPSGDAGDT